MTNRLQQESSPYLRQHAHNPVDWYPWGAEALEAARKKERPIFLSIGYSACHWCHVMERESFEDPTVGKLLNEHFISIKVDREERPDLDQIYMTAVQLLTRQGGWPMSVFLTPDLKPFYGGTYFPPVQNYGRPSFTQVLNAIHDAWVNRREAVHQTAAELTGNIDRVLQVEPHPGQLDDSLLRAAAKQLLQRFDPVHGGFGGAPKFPHPMDLRLLLRCWKRFGERDYLAAACKTLEAMALGGIYDHLGGGFHRYSTDERWLAPHFEKMLYDNALLTPAYLEAFQATGTGLFREIAEETLAYVSREMTSPEGAFFSTQDADSEGVEGKFFVWDLAEIEKLLEVEESHLFAAVYDVTPHGNWEEHNILHRSRGWDVEAKMLGLSEAELRARMSVARQKLYEVRERRIHPGRDEKILTAWNGLMISAFAAAFRVLGNVDYLDAAKRSADFVLTRMRAPSGLLLRTCGAGSNAKLNGCLEDYAYVIDGLVGLFEASAEERWITAALELLGIMNAEFWDEQAGGYFFTGKSHESLIARNKDPHDNSTPSANATAATALLRLAKLTGRSEFRETAVALLQAFRGVLESSPGASGQMLLALDFHLGPGREIVVVGDVHGGEYARVRGALQREFRPWDLVIACESVGHEDATGLLHGKRSQGAVTTYICRDGACAAPLVGADAALEALRDA